MENQDKTNSPEPLGEEKVVDALTGTLVEVFKVIDTQTNEVRIAVKPAYGPFRTYSIAEWRYREQLLYAAKHLRSMDERSRAFFDGLLLSFKDFEMSESETNE